jgi:hypothetical protein
MSACFKMRKCISLCGPEVNVNKTHISKVDNVKSRNAWCVLSGESATQHKSKYFAVNSQLIYTLLLSQNV